MNHKLHGPVVFLALMGLSVLPAWAGLDSPSRTVVCDTSAIRFEKGIEFVRSTEQVGLRRRWPHHLEAEILGVWKTDWQTPEGGTDRIRQDGRWYVGLNRSLLDEADVWMAAAGEHFDDRPLDLTIPPASVVQIPPRSPDLATGLVFTSARNVSTVRILRAGGGVTVRPWQPLTAEVGLGSVEDRRIGSRRSGLGLWTHASINRWTLAGYDQSLNLDYNRETPRDRNNEDLSGRYVVFREFYEGNSNRAEIAASRIGRDVYSEASSTVSRRVEETFAARDALAYTVVRGVRAEISGEILHQATKQSQSATGSSSLVENQAGFATSLEARRGAGYARLDAGWRTVTQTIRGDILQGLKTDLAVQGRLPLPARSALGMHLAVSKYTLDTRSVGNYDDRDELRYDAQATFTQPLFHTLVYQLNGMARLDHLVYLYRQSSANNRWTRFFLAGSTLRHQPVAGFVQTLRASVSANYQDYDFETDPRTTRSTVYRRVTLADSLALVLYGQWSLIIRGSWQAEEFGRLFWDSFEEERSDQIHSTSADLDLIFQAAPSARIGAGALYDRRRGERYTVPTKSEMTVFQSLESYGPSLLLERTAGQGLFVSAVSRVLRQFQLERRPRWIVIADVTGGFRW